MGDIAIRVQNISKAYRFGLGGAVGRESSLPFGTLRDALSGCFSASLRATARALGVSATADAGKRGEKTAFWALKEVDFEIRSGEVLAIIGANGAGKSTLLKILSRITEPTEGSVDIWGRVGSLLEVGSGFHPELTGRENIYLNGAILGMKKKEIDRKFDEIVSFAEVEGFIDTPVKHYSSGMYTRLAFAVAAHMDTEILLVDEVLAVGDAAFQKKCLGKMGDVAQGGRTVLLVSHNMGAVRGLCERAIWLDRGRVRADGPAAEVVNDYLSQTNGSSFTAFDTGNDLVIENVCMRNGRRDQTSHFLPGQEAIIEISYEAKRPVRSPYIWLMVQSSFGPCFAANMMLDGHTPKALEGHGCLQCTFKSLPLLPQSYTVEMCIRASDGHSALMKWQTVASFIVGGNLRDYGFGGQLLESKVSIALPVVIPYEWVLPDGSVHHVDLTSGCSQVVLS